MAPTKLKSVWQASQSIVFIKFLRDQIATLTDDEEAIRDTLEGELYGDEVDSVMNSLLHERALALEIAAAHKAYASRLGDAAAAKEAYADKIKAMIGDALRAASQDSWKGVLGSVTISSGKIGVEVTDAAKIPEQYFKPTLMKSAVNEAALAIYEKRRKIIADATLGDKERALALEALPELPGTAIKWGDDILTIRPPNGKKSTEQTP